MTAKKTALVIGGSGGIGSTIVERLLHDGFIVCATYAHDGEHRESLRSLRDKSVPLYRMDLLDESGTCSAMRQIVKEHSRVDVVVFAPTLPTPHTPLLQSEWSDFASHFAVQVRGMWQIVRELEHQIKTGSKMKFIIIITEACIGKPPGGLAPYVTAKYGLMGFAKMMAVEFGRYNCTVNMISPGMVATNLLKNVPPKLIEMAAIQNPLRRIAKAEDVAEVVSFLSSDKSHYLNGIHITVNGGGVMM